MPVEVGETVLGFTFSASGTLSTAQYVWQIERLETRADAVTILSLPGSLAVSVAEPLVIRFADGSLDFRADGAAASVLRLYSAILGRPPDPGGLAAWTGALEAGMPRLSIVEGFLESREFQLRFGSLSNADLVTALYRKALGRAPDAMGFAAHLADLQAGKPRTSKILEFTESAEAKLQTQLDYPSGIWVEDRAGKLVGLAYDAVFDRLPDPGGLSYWAAALRSGALSPDNLVSVLATSAEFRTRHAGSSDRDFVASIYASALEREPDAGGLAHWVSLLAGRVLTREQIAAAIAYSEEATNQFERQPAGDAFDLF